jgi:hypothetical protein
LSCKPCDAGMQAKPGLYRAEDLSASGATAKDDVSTASARPTLSCNSMKAKSSGNKLMRHLYSPSRRAEGRGGYLQKTTHHCGDRSGDLGSVAGLPTFMSATVKRDGLALVPDLLAFFQPVAVVVVAPAGGREGGCGLAERRPSTFHGRRSCNDRSSLEASLCDRNTLSGRRSVRTGQNLA